MQIPEIFSEAKYQGLTLLSNSGAQLKDMLTRDNKGRRTSRRQEEATRISV